MKRWLKRLWLRYLYYCKEHWFIAASAGLTMLWLIWQAALTFWLLLVEIAITLL